MKRFSIIIFVLIILLGFFLRFYKLGDYPRTLHRDEAFLGYNAYSILKTGRDMSGNLFPLHLQSFIYSPAGYSYLSIPFIKFFDLNVFSVRFASAFFGSLTIVIAFFLTRQLFPNGRNKLWISLLAPFFLAISPWHINLARTATENTVVVFFVSLGTLLYLLWIRKESWYLLFLSFFSFGLTLLIYQAPRAFLPFFIPLLVICFSFSRIKKKKIVSPILLFTLLIMIPILIILSSKNLSLRIRTVSILSGTETQLILDQQIREDGVAETKNIATRTFHNKLIGYSSVALTNYFKHFSFDFLFTDKGLPDRYRVPLNGLLPIFELPLLILGVWYLLRSEKKAGAFLIGWVLLAPIGSALTFDDVPNLQRTLVVFPALSIISASGFFYLLSKIAKKILVKTLLISTFSVLILYSFSFYLHQYYLHAPVYRPWHRQDGYKELAVRVNELLPKYKKAVITDRESAPAIFSLFYNTYDPAVFQKEKEKNMLDYDRINFGKYEFSQEECPARVEKNNGEVTIVGERGTLYVNSGLCEESGKGIKTLRTIQRLDNSVVFRIVAVD